ncbi:MAG: hypothetical protein EXR50_02000 [Dehalococcoidia bacterium]|nr:hypothetical protein [Dehalococcoidia bacterium]
MQPIIESHKEEISALCRRFYVRRLEVFGSAVRDDFDPAHSDVDLLVELDPVAPKSFDLYFGFKEAMEALLGRPVDLVQVGAVKNPYLRAAIEASKQVVYAA